MQSLSRTRKLIKQLYIYINKKTFNNNTRLTETIQLMKEARIKLEMSFYTLSYETKGNKFQVCLSNPIQEFIISFYENSLH